MVGAGRVEHQFLARPRLRPARSKGIRSTGRAGSPRPLKNCPRGALDLHGSVVLKSATATGSAVFPGHRLRHERRRLCKPRNRGPWPSLCPARCTSEQGTPRGRLRGSGRKDSLRPQPGASVAGRNPGVRGLFSAFASGQAREKCCRRNNLDSW